MTRQSPTPARKARSRRPRKQSAHRSRKPRIAALIAFAALFCVALTLLSARPVGPWSIPLHHPATVQTAAAPIPPPLPDPSCADAVNPQGKVSVLTLKRNGVPVVLVEGGVAGTRRAAQRCGVAQFVTKSGAQAGLNGTFFSDARLKGTDSRLIGPTLCGGDASAVLDRIDMGPAVAGRPLVLISPNRTRIVAYDPKTMDDDAALRRLLPGVTDAFLGGAWLVHDDVPATPAQLDGFHVRDAEDTRRRAFFLVTDDGRPGLGATTDVTSSRHLARALPGMGVREAVLVDSGFSTSLVLGHRILVTGHTSPGLASRPVPHAIVLFRPLAPAAAPTSSPV